MLRGGVGVAISLGSLIAAGLVGVTPAQADACTPKVSTAGSDVVLTFDDTSVGTCQWTPPAGTTTVRVLVVAGGGGGGVNYRGGGGAGGMQDVTASVTPGVAVTVSVGDGGAGAKYGPGYTGWWHNQFVNTISATNGGNSSFGSIVSVGGGFGSGCYAGVLNAGDGGSGGGSTGCTAGVGIAGQGNNGSTSGGGGGAGGTPTTAGGAGLASDITGASVVYAGGGGRQGATGGSGGGGAGANAVGNSFALSGTNSLGGGGGGGGYFPDGSRLPDGSNDTSVGGRGGSGVVVVRFAKGSQSITAAATPNPVRVLRQATLSASGYSGTGAISFAVTSGGTYCSVSGSTLTALLEGTCQITATIADDTYFLGATSAPLTVTVSPRLAQIIRVVATPRSLYVPGSLTLSADGYSGSGAISYAIASGSVCSLIGTTLSISRVGSCEVTASIAQDDTYAAATSAPVTVVGDPVPAPPDPPIIATAIAGNAQVSIRWARPDREGTAPISEYRVYSSAGKLVCTVRGGAGVLYGCTATGMVNGRPYEFWVTAINAVGESGPSKRLTATPKADRPSPPTLTSLAPGHERAIAVWKPPAYDGGAPISEYRVKAKGVGEVCSTLVSAESPYTCVMTGLTNNRSYEMWVVAVNEAGESIESNHLWVIPNPVRPGPPREVTGTPGNFRVSVSWQPPLDQGTYPVEVYQVWFDGSGASCEVAAPQTTCDVEGLVPGKSYSVKVRAWSKAGWGPLSSSTLTLTPPAPNIGYPEVRRNRKDPTKMTVTVGTTGIRPGTRLYTLPPMTGDEYDRPVVQPNGTFVWKATVPIDQVWYVVWCTDSQALGLCSPRTLLIDPYFTPQAVTRTFVLPSAWLSARKET